MTAACELSSTARATPLTAACPARRTPAATPDPALDTVEGDGSFGGPDVDGDETDTAIAACTVGPADCLALAAAAARNANPDGTGGSNADATAIAAATCLDAGTVCRVGSGSAAATEGIGQATALTLGVSTL